MYENDMIAVCVNESEINDEEKFVSLMASMTGSLFRLAIMAPPRDTAISVKVTAAMMKAA
ncbi:hypothetical protein SAMN06272722_10231 [Paenibacillus sp. RU5A]|nr:hypothetical protein SAMN06272722_10231 [Paenibacillus sp. RU5A]